MPLQQRLDEIKSREKAATPGPWEHRVDWDAVDEYSPSVEFCWGISKVSEDGFTGSVADGLFIAKSRTDLPFLVQALEIATQAMSDSIARADDYGDSYNSQPIREALKQIKKLAGEK